jgi:hypothetical protein
MHSGYERNGRTSRKEYWVTHILLESDGTVFELAAPVTDFNRREDHRSIWSARSGRQMQPIELMTDQPTDEPV